MNVWNAACETLSLQRLGSAGIWKERKAHSRPSLGSAHPPLQYNITLNSFSFRLGFCFCFFFALDTSLSYFRNINENDWNVLTTQHGGHWCANPQVQTAQEGYPPPTPPAQGDCALRHFQPLPTLQLLSPGDEKSRWWNCWQEALFVHRELSPRPRISI